MTEVTDDLDTSLDVVPDPTASEVHPRLAQRALVPGSLNGTIEVGPPGQDGTAGENGVGVPPGGTQGQVLVKVDDDDYDTEWVDAPTGGGGGSAVVAGPPITGAITVAPNTFYPINLAANLGNVPITMPAAPDQGTVVEFVRQDTNIFTSTARVTAGAGDNIGDTSPYVISMRNSAIVFTYWGTTWWPTMPVGGASGLSGATPSSAFAPTIMSRDNFGRSQIENPVAPKDIVNLEYLQAHGGSGSDEVAIRPDDPATPQPTVELWVDTDDTSTGVSVPTPITDWNLAIPGGYYYGIGNTPNAPSTATYAGITYTDGQPGHFTQVVYRIASTSTSVEQWQRQMIGGSTWTPWTPVLGPDTGWVPLTGYLPGWGPGTFGYPSAYRIQNGRCRMRGNVKNVNAWVQGGNNILTLPVAARPAQVCEFTGAITTNTTAVTQRIEIGGQTGTVTVTSTNAFSAGTWVSLDGIEYDLI